MLQIAQENDAVHLLFLYQSLDIGNIIRRAYRNQHIVPEHGSHFTDPQETLLKERNICGIGIHGNNHRYIFRSDRARLLLYFLPYSLFPGIGLYFQPGSFSNPSFPRQRTGNRTLGDSQFFRYIIKSNFPIPLSLTKAGLMAGLFLRRQSVRQPPQASKSHQYIFS